MNKVNVRCWEENIFDVIEKTLTKVLVAYPEGNDGCDLVICRNCGEIYAIEIMKEVYTGPSRNEKLKTLVCIKCNKNLADTVAPYPENYLTISGMLKKWTRPYKYPDESKSIIKEFPAIY